MNKESLGQDFQRAVATNKLRFGGALVAAGVLTVAGISSCNDEASGPDQSLSIDTSHTLTLDEMGADAVAPLKTPKIFSCGPECLSPEDREALPDDVERQLTLDGKLVPKIFRCDAGCIGPAAAETPSADH